MSADTHEALHKFYYYYYYLDGMGQLIICHPKRSPLFICICRRHTYFISWNIFSGAVITIAVKVAGC